MLSAVSLSRLKSPSVFSLKPDDTGSGDLGVTGSAGCSCLGRKDGDLHCDGPSKPVWTLAFTRLEGKNTLLGAGLVGRM